MKNTSLLNKNANNEQNMEEDIIKKVYSCYPVVYDEEGCLSFISQVLYEHHKQDYDPKVNRVFFVIQFSVGRNKSYENTNQLLSRHLYTKNL